MSKSQPLLDKAYDCRTDGIVSENIRKAENQVDAMGLIAEFLVQKKYEKTKDHLDEVEESEVEVAAAWDRYTTNILECIKAAAGEADIQGMTLEDALCLVCLTCFKDNRLWEKLSELETPTLPAFAVLIDA